MFRNHILTALMLQFLIVPTAVLRAESQGGEYKGVTDPFGDPANYEFAEDEKEDKEFFHLGRFLMLGVNVGVGIFSGGLGKTTSPGFMIGGKLLYFFDKSFGLEGAVHYARHDNVMQPDSNTLLKIDTYILPITIAFRYYFDTKSAPKAIAVANPYLVGGGGLYLRGENIVALKNFPQFTTTNTVTNNYGALIGGGTEFNVYRKHIYLGLDLRYHFIFFNDADNTFGGKLQPGDRAGGYFSSLVSITYNY